MSRAYASEVLEVFHNNTGPWARIAAKQVACEASGCSGAVPDNCEVDGAGTCSASRAWVVGNLAASEDQGGAGLISDRCGIFGRMMADGAGCLPQRSQAECESTLGPASGARCAWDELRGVCDASREDLLFVLRRDYKDELARVSLRRERCASKLPSACDGDCHMVNGHCTLRAVDALLAVAGEDCPFAELLRQNAGCSDLSNNVTCKSRKRLDGLSQCHWRRDQCEANPIALEFDLLLVLGLGEWAVMNRMRQAQAQCALTSSTACATLCALPVTVPSAAAVMQPTFVLFFAVWALACLN